MVNVNIPLLALIAGFGVVALAQLGILSRGSGQRLKLTKIGLVLAAVGGVLFIPAIATMVTNIGVPLQFDVGGDDVQVPVLAVPTTQATPSGICAVEDTTVTLSAVNKHTQAATGGSHRYRINGGPALTVSDAGTFTASPGDKLDILWYNASTSGGYFSDISTESVTCSGTKTFSKDLGRNGTVTLQVFNEEGNVLDTTTENETLAAGDTVTLKAEIRGTYQRDMPFGGLLIVEYNTTEIDDVVADFGEGTTAVPISAQFYTIGATDHGVKAYKIAAINSNALLTGKIFIDVDDTVNPGNADDIDLTLRQYNYYIDDDNGGAYKLGVEDEDNVATQPTNTITATLSTD